MCFSYNYLAIFVNRILRFFHSLTLAVIACSIITTYFLMRKYQISIIISIITISGIIFQNYRLVEMYNKSRGKNRAFFGFTEIAQLDVKFCLGLLCIISLVFGILAILKKENLKLSIISVGISLISIVLLLIRLWTYMI